MRGRPTTCLLALAAAASAQPQVPEVESAGDLVSMGIGSYARVIPHGDGLLGTFAHYEDGQTSLRVVVAPAKDGAKWDRIGTIASAPSATRDLDNPFTFELASGRLLAAYRNHDRQSPAGPYEVFRISLSASDNGGRDWDFVADVVTEPGPTTGSWEPFIRYADGSNSTLELYYSREESLEVQDILVRTSSTSDSKAWSAAETVPGRNGAVARDGMPVIARLGDKLFAVFESNPDGHYAIYMTERAVGAGTAGWGGRRRIFEPTCKNSNNNKNNNNNKTNKNKNGSPPPPPCHAGAPSIAAVGDALVVGFQTNEDGNLGQWPDGAASKFIVSADAGANWSPATEWHSAPSRWGGLLSVDDQTFLATVSDQRNVYSRQMKLKD